AGLSIQVMGDDGSGTNPIMNLTPASLKTQRRNVFKHFICRLSQTSSSLCVSASLREHHSAITS
ncbi:MAG: hypothetical protein WCJ09_14635, partial [Planctomycetota bacterium]